MANSTGFPCIAAGLCPQLDEFGDVSCKWSYKSMGCEPAHSCEYKFPKCELRAGFKKWKKVGRLVSDQLGALDDAFRNRKKCSEPGAGPYCIRDADGLGLVAEWGGLVITFLGGSALSIRAIETPGDGAFFYVHKKDANLMPYFGPPPTPSAAARCPPTAHCPWPPQPGRR